MNTILGIRMTTYLEKENKLQQTAKCKSWKMT